MYAFIVSMWHHYWSFSQWLHVYLWDAIHFTGHLACDVWPFILNSLTDMVYPIAAFTVLFSALMVHPRTRRVTMAVIKFTNRHSPTWARYAMAVAALVPGQFDEIALVAILLVPILRSAHNRATLARIVRYQF